MDIPGYVIQATIGQGGMATAYLAIQQSLGRQVVLKVLNEPFAAPGGVAHERFLNEGRVVASLKHPNIITIYDVGSVDGQAYIAMEYIEGGDLKSRLVQNTFTPDAALDILERIASGLGAAHRRGIVHRDVKPANILFRADGTPILTDFGIAKSLTEDGNLTATGMFVGSPNYMAPEQADSGAIDARADIYSLGVIFYEMLMGRKPYVADSVIDVIHLHRAAPIPRLPERFAQFQELLDLMLAKQRSERFHDIDSLLHYLARLRASLHARVEAPAGAAETTAATRANNVRLQLSPAPRPRVRGALVLLLLLAATFYAGMHIALLRTERAAAPAVALPAAPDLPADEPPLASPAAGAPDSLQVRTALAWLGQHSLDQYRLTAPPRDNAYYYFTRLLQLDPDNAVAHAGIREVAVRLAHLAEQRIADGDYAQARAYIAAGRQLDPGNPDFAALEALAQPRRGNLFSALRDLFR